MKKIIRKVLAKIVGLDSITRSINDLDEKYKEQISTVHYFLNNYCDITKFPHDKDPNLYQLQLCDIQLLRIVDKVLRKMDVTYWLDYGTLLGAVRHKGFIPWDDDMDISVVRSDYDRLKTELPVELKKYDIDVSISNARLGIGYKHLNTGIWLDIFPDDIFYSDKGLDDMKAYLNVKQKVWRSEALPVFEDLKEDDILNLKNKIFGFPGEGINKYYIQSPEMFGVYMRIHHHNTIFPVSKIWFNEYEFNAPHNVEKFVTELYGISYMHFPKSGVLHHDLGRGPLSTWAECSGTNMQNVYSYLKKIADSL